MSYRAETNGIIVTVEPRYLSDQSDPSTNRYIWAYTVTIANESDVTVQLTGRTWNITDARGHVQNISGPGVIGEQPILKPGDSFMYTSGAPLPTSSGFMTGTYDMKTEQGDVFLAAIPVFSLDSPLAARVLN
jgi:ApaG protein